MSPRNSIASLQALRISRRTASSRGVKQWLRAREDGFSSNPVGTRLHCLAADQVYPAADEIGELAFHGDVIKQAPVGLRREGHEEIDIAVGPEIGAPRGPEHCQLRDLPAAAEFGQPGLIDDEFRIDPEHQACILEGLSSRTMASELASVSFEGS